MTELRLHNVVCQVWSPSPEASAALFGGLAFRAEGYFFSPKYKSGDWDGYTRLYMPPNSQRPFGKFWTGLAHRAITALDQANVPYVIRDERQRPPVLSPAPTPGLTAFDDQKATLQAALFAGRGIIQVPTGGGKTPLAMFLMAAINHPAIFIVHRIGLLRQSAEDFKKVLGLPKNDNNTIGVIQGETRRLRHFNVATVQTLNNILFSPGSEDIRNFIQNDCKFVGVDEAHHAGSDQYQYVLQNFINAYFRYGFTATPGKTEEQSTPSADMRVEGCFGRVVAQVGRQALTDKKRLAKAHAFYI